jgi:hypothetical protein
MVISAASVLGNDQVRREITRIAVLRLDSFHPLLQLIGRLVGESMGRLSSKFSPTSNRKPPISSLPIRASGQAACFDMKDTSEIPAVAELWFQAFNATISFRPVMNPQELARAGPSINAATKRYRK